MRRPRRALTASFLAMLVTASSVSAHADPPAPPPSVPPPPAPPAAPAGTGTSASAGDSLTGQAKDDYETARVLFENGDYAGALVKFQHAYDLSSDVRLLWDMGACEKNLRHYVRVLKLVDRYLHDGDTHITPAQRADAAAVVRTVRSLVSGIRVIVNQAGASVYVDDELVGTSPLMEPVLVDLGDRKIRVTKPGFREQSIVQHVAGASDVTITLALEPEEHETRLAVAANAHGTIQIDGNAVGTAPWEGSVSPGSHVVRVTAAGMVPYTTDVMMRDGEKRSLDVTLQPEGGGISPVWWIAGGVVAAAGLGVGGYFLFRPSSTTVGSATEGTISPYTLSISR